MEDKKGSHSISKAHSKIMNGDKPRNIYSKNILKNTVGVKAKNMVSTTLSKIGISSGSKDKMSKVLPDN